MGAAQRLIVQRPAPSVSRNAAAESLCQLVRGARQWQPSTGSILKLLCGCQNSLLGPINVFRT